ncbi:MAG: hypothetical protein KAS32_14600, partial [Candidatus Peribacteraceae bacterium]|nr:hypothetical protein [Candidatus Peribacteraceae bacterium]
MNGLLRHSPSIYKGLSELGVPFKSDLDTWHKGITDNDFAEKINNLPAKILPRVASFVAGNLDEVDTGIDLSNATDVDMTMICYRGASGIITACEAIGTSTSRCGILWFTDNMIYCITMNGSSSQNGSILYNNTGWFTLRMVYNGGGLADADKLKLYINGNLQTLSYAATIPSSLGVIANTFTIGHALNGYTAGLISYVSVSKDGATASQYYPTGQGDYEYDVSGNNNHGTWSGTGSRYDFDLNGSRYANDNG